jgi:GNAT superfamily N-acetyltransferase
MITISKPQPEDAEDMNEVIKQSWYATYVTPEVGIPKEDIDQMYTQSEKQQIETFRKRAASPKDTDITLVAKENDSIVGVIRLVIFDDHTRVRTFYVHPSYTGKGIGTKLWNEGIKVLPHDRPVIAWPAEHTHAVDFYKKLGFIPTGEKELGEPMSSGSKLSIVKTVFHF